MTIALTVSFQGMAPSSALRADIARRIGKLERLAVGPLACDVTVRMDEHRHQQGNRYNVHAHLSWPGGPLEAGKTAPQDKTHENPYRAVRDTFAALRRQMAEHIRMRHAAVKTPVPDPPAASGE